jgi:hypothetical protein
VQLYRCQIKHAGKPYTVIYKEDVTPADIVIMRQIHGTDAVANIEATRESRDSAVKLRQRLKDTYGEKVFARCYPGLTPILPRDLGEAGLREDGRSLEDVAAEEADELDAAEVAKATAALPAPSGAAQAIAEKVLAATRAKAPAAGALA